MNVFNIVNIALDNLPFTYKGQTEDLRSHLLFSLVHEKILYEKLNEPLVKEESGAILNLKPIYLSESNY